MADTEILATSGRGDEENPELNGSAGSSETRPYTHHYYTLPTLRYSTVFRAIVLIDALLSLALWLSGGDSSYFLSSIVHFSFTHSVFDVAVTNAVKAVLTFAILDTLENVTLKIASRRAPLPESLDRRKFLLHAVLILVHLAVFALCMIKGALILDGVVNNDTGNNGNGGGDHDDITNSSGDNNNNNNKNINNSDNNNNNSALSSSSPTPTIHAPYYALLISSVVFSAIELLLSVLSFAMMRRIPGLRVEHFLAADGREVDRDGKPIARKASLARLVTMAGPEVPMIAGGTFFLLISSASTAVAPLFFGYVIDAAQESMAALNHTVLVLLGIYACGAVASSFRSYLFTLAGQHFVARLRKLLFSAIIRQDIAFFDTTRTGELTNRLSSDTQVLQNAVTVNMSMLARYLLQIIGSLALMFMLNASLTGVLLAVVPVISIGAVQYGRFVMRIRKAFQDRLAEASTTAEESISSMRTVRAFTGEPKANRAYGADIDKSYGEGKKLALVSGAFDGLIGTVSYAAIVMVLWYGGKLVFEKVITPGIVTSFLLYTLQVAMAFAFLSSLYGDFMQALGASVRIFELLDREPAVPLEGGLENQQLDGSVEFSEVNFTYPSRPDTPVLKNVSFHVAPGKMVALVGPSGGGKSTIVNLIERFYDPDSGTITLGGHDLRSLSPEWFRSKVAMVSQEPTLFACSIKDNIAYGRAHVEMDEIMEAAKQANAHEFIEGFEEGYDTLVGERGIRLSGGQKQRIAIARALLVNPHILLLDEATSALDAESEHLVQEAIDRAMQGGEGGRRRTVLVIAHRLSTVRSASTVVVVDKGEIVECGSHEELVARPGGVYSRLVLRQLMAANRDNMNIQELSAESMNADEEGVGEGVIVNGEPGESNVKVGSLVNLD